MQQPAPMTSQSYFRALWHHDFPDEPVEFRSELDQDRYEARKLEIHRDGKVGWAGRRKGACDATLGDQPLPPIDEIDADRQFTAKAVSQEAFEAMWLRRFERITERPDF